MTESRKPIPEIDPSFFENQRNFPPEELEKYAGQFIAWSLDGSRILAGADDRQLLDQQLRATGIDPAYVVHDYADPPDQAQLG
jgi:hypothetical protein